MGDLNASQMKAADVSIKNTAHGNVQLYADRSFNISHQGPGFIHYSGNGVVKDIKQYGHGEVKRVKLNDEVSQ